MTSTYFGWCSVVKQQSIVVSNIITIERIVFSECINVFRFLSIQYKCMYCVYLVMQSLAEYEKWIKVFSDMTLKSKTECEVITRRSYARLTFEA